MRSQSTCQDDRFQPGFIGKRVGAPTSKTAQQHFDGQWRIDSFPTDKTPRDTYPTDRIITTAFRHRC